MRNRFAWQFLVVFGLLQLAIVDLSARGNWVALENCRLILNPANDGDSFHVRVNEKDYLFRLYFVDAPETDSANPARLIEQAKHFGISVPQVIEKGEAAKEFTQEKLAEPFTVVTRMANAMGRSNTERFYALVQTKEGDLGEQLVANGLARIYGRTVTPPGASSSAAERQKLQELEAEAKQHKLGGWATTPRPGTPIQNQGKHIATDKIDINTATEKELRTIPGIGPVMARRIIDARPFKNADELKKVEGIGDKKYAQVRPYFN
jgi:endonuclease YncB( thermonuclease family)